MRATDAAEKAAQRIENSMLEHFDSDYSRAGIEVRSVTWNLHELPSDPVIALAGLVVRAEVESARARAKAQYSEFDSATLNSRLDEEANHVARFVYLHELTDEQMEAAFALSNLAILAMNLAPDKPLDLWGELGLNKIPQELPEGTEIIIELPVTELPGAQVMAT